MVVVTLIIQIEMAKQVTIRTAYSDDYDTVANVMYDAVRHGRSAYSQAQRQAWMPAPRSGVEWSRRLDSQTVFVAETSAQVVGFMSLAEKGYIDLAYIRPNAQGTGLFRLLFQTVENHAIQAGERRLWVHASHNARPAFTAMGFSLIRKESVEIDDQTLERFVMEKRLRSAKSESRRQ